MPSLRRLALVPLAMFTLAACGSEVNTATGGSGGTGGNTGGGGGGNGGAATCPATAPGNGQPCSAKGLSCTYGDGCCPPMYDCDGSTWQLALVDCAPPTSCPVALPAAGATCDVCYEAGPCEYACPGTTAQVSATCNGGTWAIAGDCPVPPPVDCNGTACKPGEICVQSAGGAGFSYLCAADPCFPAQLSCDCAGELCGGAPFECNGAMGQELFCSCPMCP